MPIIKKIIKNICYRCDGKGKVEEKQCSTCKGTGIFEDEIYYFMNNKTKECWDGDTLK